MVTFRGAGATGNEIKVPNVYLRIWDDASGDRYGGDVTDDFILISQSKGPGPLGGSITVRSTKYAYHSDEDRRALAADVLDKVFTVEVKKRLSNRRVQDVQFMGYIDSQNIQFSPAPENGIDFTVRDFWYRLADLPVSTVTARKTVGMVATDLDNGYYLTQRWTMAGTIFTTTHQYYPNPWPTGPDDERLVYIDKAILESRVPAGSLSINGQSLAQVLCDLVGLMGNYLPVIRYEGTTAYVTAVERGVTPRQIVIGTTSEDEVDHKYVPDVQEIRGTIDYSNVRNRIIGVGAPARTSRSVDLNPAWPTGTAAETLVINNPYYATLTGYQTIGRLYELDEDAFPFQLKPLPLDYGLTSGHAKEDGVVIWSRKNSEDTWKIHRAHWQPMRLRSDGSIDNGINDRGDIGYQGTRWYIFFDEVQTWSDYSAEAETYRAISAAQVALGLSPLAVTYTPQTWSLYEFQAQVVQVGNEVIMDTGVIGDNFPRTRSTVVRNLDMVRELESERYQLTATGGRVDVTGTKSLRDDRGTFLYQLQSYAERTSRPEAAVSLMFDSIYFSWDFGHYVQEIIDTEGTIQEDNAGWGVDSIEYDWENVRMSIVTSDIYRDALRRGYA